MSVEHLSLEAMKWVACALGALAAGFTVFAIAENRQSLPYRYWAVYVAYLERSLRCMFITTPGHYIALGQLIAMLVALGLGLSTREPLFYALIGVAVAGPALVLSHLKRRRVKRIEAKLDGFILALANALKATPSLGNALEYVEPLLAPPLNQEIRLALKEMRVGTTLEQALLNVSARIQSVELDATLTGLLIARQVGGDLPKILETTAATLREMTRLQGVVRTKTAEGKVQLFVVALFPAGLLFGFDLLSPGYFNPLTQQPLGYLIIGACVVMWIAALVIARKVLAVEL
ncbi:MAG TPA: type II secretion system F family protein [Polyangiaceae bacterium]|nr:type II secretion system F family protein [Polyangiaceae bacterium]